MSRNNRINIYYHLVDDVTAIRWHEPCLILIHVVSHLNFFRCLILSSLLACLILISLLAFLQSSPSLFPSLTTLPFKTCPYSTFKVWTLTPEVGPVSLLSHLQIAALFAENGFVGKWREEHSSSGRGIVSSELMFSAWRFCQALNSCECYFKMEDPKGDWNSSKRGWESPKRGSWHAGLISAHVSLLQRYKKGNEDLMCFAERVFMLKTNINTIFIRGHDLSEWWWMQQLWKFIQQVNI